MAENTMIEVDNVSMSFRMDRNRVTSLKEWAITFMKGQRKIEDFWALSDVSFSVEKGEVFGIIGRNGAGKSTILKVISGIMKPTKGKVTAYGRIVPMLELGSGFDMELSGRENIFLNGAILGFSRKYLTDKLDEIVDYAELREFIDMPLKTYSSGMLARLAFSVGTMVKPEILIVDEVLSVGDEKFQRKSSQRMQELMGGGTTVLFVAHDTHLIQSMCKHVLWLDHGHLVQVGLAEEVCEAYRQSNL